MRHINKLAQQRRRQLHVHIAPSGLQMAPNQSWMPSALGAPPTEGRKVIARRPVLEGSTLD